MEHKINFEFSTRPYLCKNKRYKLSRINRIDDEYVIFASTFFRDVSLLTKNYIYKFEREEDEKNKDLAFFKERVPCKQSKENLECFESKIPTGGYNYIYTEKDMNITFGDYPRYPEYLKRIQEKIARWKKEIEEDKEMEKQREKERENKVNEEENSK